MTLRIQSEILPRIPGLTVMVARLQLPPDAGMRRPGHAEAISQWWAERSAELEGADLVKHPALVPWLDLWSSLGVSVKQHPPSILGLLNRAARGGKPPLINPVVDCYNALSLELMLPLGAFDCRELNGEFTLRISPGDENFLGIGATNPEKTKAGEIVYADDTNILTRHFLWRQSQKAMITPETTEVLLLCELLPPHLKDLHRVRAICERRIEEHLRPLNAEWLLRP